MFVRLFLPLIIIPLLVHGGDGLYVALTSRVQEQATCEEYGRQPPRSSWVKITGCEFDYTKAAYRQEAGNLWRRLFSQQDERPRIVELFFPAPPSDAPPGTPAAVVVSTRDPAILSMAEGTLLGGAPINQEAFLVTMLQVVTAMGAREVEGMKRSPLEMIRSRRALAGIRAPLADDYTIVDLHRRPHTWLPAVEVAAGVVALAFVASALRRKKPQPAQKAAAALEIPQLMLLNLPASATPAAIETAPQLGLQREVRERLAGAVSGLTFDDAGKGYVSAATYAVEVDVGTADPVYTAVLTLRGDATGALARILRKTGWRAFAPKRGAFVTAADFGARE